MSLLDVPSRLDERSATIYLAVGTLAILKAVALRNDSRRFRRELREAALFLGLGLVLRTYHKRRSAGSDEDQPATDAEGEATETAAESAESDRTEGTDERPDGDEGIDVGDEKSRTRLERTARRLVPTS